MQPAAPLNRSDQIEAVGNLLRGLGEERAAAATTAPATDDKYGELDPGERPKPGETPAGEEPSGEQVGQVADLLGSGDDTDGQESTPKPAAPGPVPTSLDSFCRE